MQINTFITINDIINGLNHNGDGASSFGGASIEGIYKNYVEDPKEPMTASQKETRSIHSGEYPGPSAALQHLKDILGRVPVLKSWGEKATAIIVDYFGWIACGAHGDLRSSTIKNITELRSQYYGPSSDIDLIEADQRQKIRIALNKLGGRISIVGGAALWALAKTGCVPFNGRTQFNNRIQFNDFDCFTRTIDDFSMAMAYKHHVNCLDVAFYDEIPYELVDLKWCEVMFIPSDPIKLFASRDCYDAIYNQHFSRLQHIINFRNVIRPDRTALRIGKYMDKYRWLLFPVADALALLSIWKIHEKIENATLAALRNWTHLSIARAY